MRSNQSRNWLLTIAQIRMPLLIWTVIVVTFFSVAATYLIKPIYSATTVLTLDADLKHVLGNAVNDYPAVTNSDFIRYEYFATHTLNLMRLPQLAEQFVAKWDVRDDDDCRLFPEYLIDPSLFRLLFNNNGQGIELDWISDTQQFAVRGMSKDPDKAVDFSIHYAKLILEANTRQFEEILKGIIARLESRSKMISAEIKEVDHEISKIRSAYATADIASELEALTNRIVSIKAGLDEAELAEKTYQSRLDHISHELGDYEKLRQYEIVLEANPQINVLKTEIEQVSASLAAASIDYTPDHPSYKAIQQKLNVAKETLKKEATNILQQDRKRASGMADTALARILDLKLDHLSFLTRAEHYKSLLNDESRRLKDLETARIEIENFDRKKRSLSNFLGTTNESRFAIESILKNPLPLLRIVSLAQIDKDNVKYYKYFPKRKRILLITSIASFFAFAFLIIGRELHANTLYMGWQVDALDRKMAYAEVPLNKLAQSDNAQFKSHICKYIHDLLAVCDDSRVIRITSGASGEGKATVGTALAWRLSKMGKSVAIIDGNLADRSLTRTMGLLNSPGVGDYLVGAKGEKEVIVDDCIARAAFIPTGMLNPETLRDFPSLTSLTQLVAVLNEKYERIIFLDSPMDDDDFMLADGLPSHDTIMVLASGRHSVHAVDCEIRRNQLVAGNSSLKAIIVNKVIFAEDVFSWNGFSQWIMHILKMPSSFIQKVKRA